MTTNADRLIAQVSKAAERREAVAQAGRDRLVDILAEAIDADPVTFVALQREAGEIDPSFDLGIAVFRAGTVRDEPYDAKALKAAQAAHAKAGKDIEQAEAAKREAIKRADAVVQEAKDAEIQARAILGEAQVTENRRDALRGELRGPDYAGYHDPVLRAWAKKAGIV